MLHNAHLEISKSVQECTKSFLLSESLRTRAVRSRGESLVEFRSPVLLRCNMFLGGIEQNGESLGTCINFSKRSRSVNGTQHSQGLGYIGSWRGRTIGHDTKWFIRVGVHRAEHEIREDSTHDECLQKVE